MDYYAFAQSLREREGQLASSQLCTEEERSVGVADFAGFAVMGAATLLVPLANVSNCKSLPDISTFKNSLDYIVVL